MAEVGGGWERRSIAEVGSEGWRRRSEAEAEVDVRVRISCGVVLEVVVQASGFARGVSIPVFISMFPFIFFQCLSSRLNGLHLLCISDLIVVLF